MAIRQYDVKIEADEIDQFVIQKKGITSKQNSEKKHFILG